MTLPPRTTRRRKTKPASIPDEVRAEVEKRSRGVCEMCRWARGQHMHHRKMRSQGGGHTASNLLHLCFPCHTYVHEHPADSYANGWLLHSWDD